MNVNINKPQVLKVPRSEDMRLVVDAQLQARGGMVIYIDNTYAAQLKSLIVRKQFLDELRIKSRILMS